MLRKCLFFMLLFIGIVHFSLGEEIGLKNEENINSFRMLNDFYITPRIGFSSFTGYIGIELQYKHFAFGIGYLYGGDSEIKLYHTLMYGIKYYFKPHRSTWYIGLGGTEQGKFIYEGEGKKAIGFVIGYRWRWGKGWDFSLGLGAGISRKTDMGVTEGELALGYSF